MQRWSPNGSNALKASIEALKCANEPGLCPARVDIRGVRGVAPPG
jgi:hypothetical protein